MQGGGKNWWGGQSSSSESDETDNCPHSSLALPPAREVSSTFHPGSDLPQDRFSLMVMQFGQFLDHDLALTPEVELHSCCEHPDQHGDCLPIQIPSQDPFYSRLAQPQRCLEFTRSDAFCSNDDETGSYSVRRLGGRGKRGRGKRGKGSKGGNRGKGGKGGKGGDGGKGGKGGDGGKGGSGDRGSGWGGQGGRGGEKREQYRSIASSISVLFTTS